MSSFSIVKMTLYEHPPKYIAYGTAGFRDKADDLETIVYRVGHVAAMRSRSLHGQSIGVMITASHNPPADNGAKLVDPYGDMLEQSWEPKVAKVANAGSSSEFKQLINEMYKELNIDPKASANIAYGRDTRASGPALTKALKDGLSDAGARGTDLGLVTTPQVHYYVRAENTLGGPKNNPKGLESYGLPTEDGYYRKLATALKAVLTPAKAIGKEPIKITVDCANGVGALKLAKLAKFLEGIVTISIVNGQCERPDLLNDNCGADYVKTNQRLPTGITPRVNELYASFDGDADRVVFYYVDENEHFHLLDGDKIATLIAGYFKQVISDLGTNLNIGVVQTAYANGSSTKYITDVLKLPVTCTPTGVKHLHHAAQEYEIGVYFEANGHGTVLFGDDKLRSLRQMSIHNESQMRAVDALLAFSDLINQTVGDSISDLLTVIAIVLVKNMTPSEWDSQYSDLPNKLLKAEVKDRTAFVTTDAERKLVAPEGLQAKIDNLVSEVQDGRSFVRASGTENVVRVYAEANTSETANKLAEDVKQLIVREYGP